MEAVRPRHRVLAEVTASISLPGEHHRLTLRAPEIVACAEPGQFLQVWCHSPEELDRPPAAAVLRRPFSISQVRPPDQLDLLLRVRGVGGALLARKVVGEQLDIIGPLGHGFEIPADLRLAVVVAGGIGLAPIPFLIEALIARGVRTALLIGTTEDARLPFPVSRPEGQPAVLPDLEALGAEVEYTSEAEEGWLVTQLLERRLEEISSPGTCCYAVGPQAMMREAARLLAGRAPLQVSLEERMACGVGACRSCVVPILGAEGPEFLTACREGPVFYATQVDWERLGHGVA